VNPSQELRDQIREWLDETLVTADGKLDPSAVESKAKRHQKRREAARMDAELAWSEGSLKGRETKPVTQKATAIASHPQQNAQNCVPNLPWPAASTSIQIATAKPVGTLRGVGTIALSAVLLMLLIGYRRELGHMVMTFGSSIAGDEQKTPATGGTPDAAPEGVTSTPAVEVNATSKPVAVPEAEAASESSTGSEAASAQTRQATNSSNAVASRSAWQQGQQEGASQDVPSLWSSVENGDMRAEVILASRYVRGQDVPQSCAQARVLLEAAAKRGSTEAKQKLDELPQAGCP
jgi:TPR repeat protein